MHWAGVWVAGFPPRPFARRIDGQLLVASLRSPQLRAWWLARDAPARWLAANPTHCLAHWLDVSSEELEAAMADASLFGRGVRARTRMDRIGAHESAEFKAGAGCSRCSPRRRLSESATSRSALASTTK